jgi:hypothetical protein
VKIADRRNILYVLAVGGKEPFLIDLKDKRKNVKNVTEKVM